jgi:hypothetical protein
MTVDDAPHYSEVFFDALARLAVRLNEQDLAIYEANYNHMAFGDWVLVIGRRHRRRRFTWDGKDSSLLIEEATFGSSAEIPSWKLVETLSLKASASVNPKESMEKVFEFATKSHGV